MQVNFRTNNQVPFQGNLPKFCPNIGDAIGKTVKLSLEEKRLIEEKLRNNPEGHLQSIFSNVLKVFGGDGAKVYGDELSKEIPGQRIIIARNSEGKVADANAEDLDIIGKNMPETLGQHDFDIFC